MQSETTIFALTDRNEPFVDKEGQLALIQYLKNQLEMVLEQIMAEKAHLEQKYKQQKRILQEEIQLKNEFIEKLQQKNRQLQGQNQQIKYQFEQRIKLMNILKNQNGLLSKEHSRQKAQMKETIDVLIAENRQLKHALIEQQYQHKVRRLCSPARRQHSDLLPQRFDRDRDSRLFQRSHEEEWLDAYTRIGQIERAQKSINRESLKDDSFSNSSMLQKHKNKRFEFIESRVTQIKGKSNKNEARLQRLQTKTILSRKRTTLTRFN